MKINQLNWLQKFAIHKYFESDRWPNLLTRFLAAVFLYVIFDRVLMAMTRLPVERYFEPVIFLAFLKHLLQSNLIFAFVPLAATLIFFRKNLLRPWSEFPKSWAVRSVVFLVAAMLAWVYSTVDFNLFFNQPYYSDRLLLLALVPLVYWRPVFVLPFLLVLLPMIGQSHALTGFSWAALFLPIRVLILFSVYFLFYLVSKRFYLHDFILFLGSMMAAHYWYSGIGKVSTEWILHDQIFLLLPATYANGWLHFMEPDTIGKTTRLLSNFNTPVKMMVLLFELGGCLFFLHRFAARFFLTGWMLMHLGIFLVSGICFWMWVVLEAWLLVLFLKKDGFADLPLFSKKHLLVSAGLVVTGAYWCEPVRLAWHDVPATYTYRMEAETKQGATVRLPPAFFGPFDYQFTLGPFGYLGSRPAFVITWGGTDEATAKLLRSANSPQVFLDSEKRYGKVNFIENQALAFDYFIQRSMTAWNAKQSFKTPFSYFKAPRLLWTFPKAPPFDGTSHIQKVRVVLIISFYHDGRYQEIRAVPVREIPIQ